MQDGMEKTSGTVTAIKTLWWIKINKKPIKVGAAAGSVFPHLIKVTYQAGDAVYRKWKYVGWTLPCPKLGKTVALRYRTAKPSRCRLEF